jgi:hypothetical protein
VTDWPTSPDCAVKMPSSSGTRPQNDPTLT